MKDTQNPYDDFIDPDELDLDAIIRSLKEDESFDLPPSRPEPAETEPFESIEPDVVKTELVEPRPKPAEAELFEMLVKSRSLEPETAEPAEKKKLGFYKKLLLGAAVALALISAGLAVFWRYIDTFEKTLPDNVMESLISGIDYSYWETGIAAAAENSVSYFEDADTVTEQLLLPALHSGVMSYHKLVSQYSDERPVYALRLGSAELARVVLAPAEGGEAGFGFNSWDVEEISLQDSVITSRQSSLKITVSESAEVLVNGLPVSDDYLIEGELEFSKCYLINGLFLEPRVEVRSADGELLEPYFNEGGQLYYALDMPDEYSFVISAPAGSVVSISGNEFNSSELGSHESYVELYGEDEVASLPELLTFTAAVQLFEEPSLSAVDAGGSKLELRKMMDGTLIFAGPYSAALEEEQKATVDSFIRAYVSYSANLGGATDANFSRIKALMLPASALYKRVDGSWDAMIWVSNAEVSYDKLEIGSFTAYGEDCFTCEVALATSINTNYQTRVTDTLYELSFVRSDGKWLAARMVELQGE